MILCTACRSNEATFDSYRGYLPCSSCRAKLSTLKTPTQPIEVTTDSIRESRKEYADQIEQPFRNGVVNSRYIKKYGTKGIQATPEEIKQARDVYAEDHFYKDED